MVTTGAKKSFSSIKIISTHGGGTIPFLVNRIQMRNAMLLFFCIRLFEAATYLLLRFSCREQKNNCCSTILLNHFVENVGSHDRSGSNLKT
jgi:hypothetical protein